MYTWTCVTLVFCASLGILSSFCSSLSSSLCSSFSASLCAEGLSLAAIDLKETIFELISVWGGVEVVWCGGARVGFSCLKLLCCVLDLCGGPAVLGIRPGLDIGRVRVPVP